MDTPRSSSQRQLAEACVEYWHVDLDSPESADVARVSPHEAARADRFLASRNRQRYLAGRAALRSLLGLYTGREAIELPIRDGPQGKPYLDLELPNGRLAFNLSHSGSLALIGFAWNTQIGVDIERIRPLEDWRSIARGCFTAAEMDVLEQLPESRRLDGFYAGWTRKEAFVKALGQGLGIPLEQFEVTMHPDHPAELCRVDESLGCGTAWQLFAPRIARGHRCAIAVSGSGWRFTDLGPYRIEAGVEGAVQPARNKAFM